MLLRGHCLLVFVLCLNHQLSLWSGNATLSIKDVLCPPLQSQALLIFKSTFVIDPNAKCTYGPKMKSWKNDTNCCFWDGVTCNEATGHVIGLHLSCSQLLGTIHSNSTLFSPYIAPYLQSLDLSGNDFLGSQLDVMFGSFTSLRNLNVHDCNISGSIPSSFGNLTKLIHLTLIHNRLSGSIPESFGNLINLTYLDLSHNHLSGMIPTSFSNLTCLYYLDMSDNEVEGPFPSHLFVLPSLGIVDLSWNKIYGQIYTSTAKSMNLNELDLSNNNLNGILDFDVLLNFKQLRYLDLSYNNISPFISASSESHLSYSLPNLGYFDLSGCKLNHFPVFIRYLTKLTYLNVSNNTMLGEISSLICNLSHLEVLDLSHNQFTGLIPKCIENLSSLSVLNLGMNKLHGVIPNIFTKHNNLKSVVLRRNQLTGSIPQSLAYCECLQMLDLGNNMIEDRVPHWLQMLLNLEILVLRSNKFFGSLNNFKLEVSFPVLRILDLSNNNFTGQFPMKLIKNLNAMMIVDERLEDGNQYMVPSPYGYNGVYYSMVIIVKGLEMEYVKIVTTLATIDLSRNKFEGHIPNIIGNLISLKSLNLSHNLLTGRIPSSIGDMTSLEWLDLSFNQLSGHIPTKLVDLTFLAFLCLSNNQFYGPIPQGKQLSTFGNDSYKDNLALCGFPLSISCDPNHEPPSFAYENKDSKSSFSWKVSFAGCGCGIVFGLSMGYVVFETGSPKWFVRMVDGKQPRGSVGKRRKRGGTRT